MELGSEGGGGGGGVLDRVVMERKTQEEGFADRIAHSDISFEKCVCVCLSVCQCQRKSGIRREENRESTHSVHFSEDVRQGQRDTKKLLLIK